MSDTVEAPPPLPPDTVEGASFSPYMKGLASALMLVLVYWGWQALQAGLWARSGASARLFLGMVTLVIAACYAAMLRSRTSIDGQHIRQSWLWPKQVKLADVTRVKLIDVPGLAWLIAPRLMVSAGGLVPTTFHAADKRVLAAFRRLAYG